MRDAHREESDIRPAPAPACLERCAAAAAGTAGSGRVCSDLHLRRPSPPGGASQRRGGLRDARPRVLVPHAAAQM